MTPARIATTALVCFFVAVPVAGFVFGFVTCSDCGLNVIGRLFIGCVMAVLTPLSGGFPARNEGGVGQPFNVWPHIIIAWILLFALYIYYYKTKISKR